MDEKDVFRPTEADIQHLRQQFEAGRNPLSYIPYADALRRAGLLVPALEICRDGLEHDSYSVTGRSLLARILYDMGRYDAAMQELGAVLQMVGEAYGANLLMARILFKKMDYHEALDIIHKIKKMNPLDTELLELEGSIHSQMFSLDTVGDVSIRKTKPELRPQSLDMKINELLQKLRSFPGVLRFSFSKMPDPGREDIRDIDPPGALVARLCELCRENHLGNLRQVTVEMDKASILLYEIEGSLLRIVTDSEANTGRLRLQVENLLK
ncbi:MAG TPA: tetratricopeptide repeat protein [Candidatus Sumerlaeota bacterium]|nr:tetratricopeptide repeat protein [Candidatus Sumerlaeota bacterium]